MKSFNINQKLALFVLGVTHILNILTVSIKLMQVGGQAASGVKIWHMKHQFFVKILFNFKKKKISLNKAKPENSLIFAKSPEFELITSCHLKNLISPKPTWNSQWNLISSRNLK